MSSYYDDPDFADEYQQRDENAINWAVSEREREIELNRASDSRATGDADR